MSDALATVILIVFLCVMFDGEPDLYDALIHTYQQELDCNDPH